MTKEQTDREKEKGRTSERWENEGGPVTEDPLIDKVETREPYGINQFEVIPPFDKKRIKKEKVMPILPPNPTLFGSTVFMRLWAAGALRLKRPVTPFQTHRNPLSIMPSHHGPAQRSAIHRRFS